MPNIVATVTAGTHGPIPDPGTLTYHVELLDAQQTVAASQTFPTLPATVTFEAVAPGTYTVRGGQHDAAGAAVGTPVTSAPVTVTADVTVTVVGALTVAVVRV